MKTKKELRNEYKLMKFRVGIFQIINKRENKIFLQTTSDMDRAFNSDKFQLNAGMHSNKDLQNDWNKFGPESFEFKILDELTTNDTESPEKIKKDIKELMEIHKNEMQLNGQQLY
jgi:hypothetical protein